MEADETPAGGLEAPAVLAEDREKILPMVFRDRLRRRRADLGRVVAYVVIAGQVAAGDRKRVVQRSGKFEIVAVGGTIEGEVAAIDHEIGPSGVDVFADALKIVGQAR